MPKVTIYLSDDLDAAVRRGNIGLRLYAKQALGEGTQADGRSHSTVPR